MMTDPLAQFRKKPLEATGANIPLKAKQSDEYVAFEGKDRVDRLRIRRALAPTRSPRYLYLYDMAYDGEYGTNFVLVFEFMVVLVTGRNLQAVIAAIEAGTADFIQEYHPDIWQKPADDAPLIESIQIYMQGTGSESAKVLETQH